MLYHAAHPLSVQDLRVSASVRVEPHTLLNAEPCCRRDSTFRSVLHRYTLLCEPIFKGSRNCESRTESFVAAMNVDVVE